MKKTFHQLVAVVSKLYVTLQSITAQRVIPLGLLESWEL